MAGPRKLIDEPKIKKIVVYRRIYLFYLFNKKFIYSIIIKIFFKRLFIRKIINNNINYILFLLLNIC